MKVKLFIYSAIKDYVDGYDDKEGVIIKFHQSKSIEQILKDTIKHQMAIDAISLVTVNDKIIAYQDLRKKVKDGDVIKAYPPLGGG